MRKPDGREIVLMAMYAEHLKPDGDFNNVRGMRLDMDSRSFLWALMQLKTEGLIGGVNWMPPGTMNPEKVTGLLRDNLHLTREGFYEAERILDAKGTERVEKMGKLVGWLISAGLQALAVALEAHLI